MRRFTLLILTALAGTGCATNLSLLQTAETLEPMHLRASAGAGAYVPVGTLRETKALADTHAGELAALKAGNGTPPDSATQREIIRLAASLAVLTPAPVAQASARLGLVDGLDAGFAWSSSAWRLDAKLRLRGGKEGHRVKVALMAGVEVYTFDVRLFQLDRYLKQDISQIFDYVHLDHPVRTDADARLVVSGKVAKIFFPYAAIEARAGIYHLPLRLTYATPDQTFTHDEDLRGQILYGGLVLGLGIGPRLFRVFVEVHGGYAQAPTTVYGEAAELGGPALFPAAGLALAF